MVLFAPAIIEKWKEKGRVEGRKEGLEEGLEKGRAEGLEKARQEYELQLEEAHARIAELEAQARRARNSYEFDIA